MFNYLLNNDVSNLSIEQYDSDLYGYDYADFDSINVERDLYSFSEISENGRVNISFEIVPEPMTVLLFGSGGLVVLRRRRKES